MLSFDSAGFCRKMKKQTHNSLVTRVAFVSLRESPKFGVRNIKCILVIAEIDSSVVVVYFQRSHHYSNYCVSCRVHSLIKCTLTSKITYPRRKSLPARAP